MARYIDAIALQRRICGARCGCECEDCGNEGDCVFEQFITFAPTADVAPRAEVAREIFEEIERIFDQHTEGGYYLNGVWFPKRLDLDTREAIAELKKKYTEGEK